MLIWRFFANVQTNNELKDSIAFSSKVQIQTHKKIYESHIGTQVKGVVIYYY